MLANVSDLSANHHKFDIMEPRKRNYDDAKSLAITITKGKAIEGFIEENPYNIDVFQK